MSKKFAFTLAEMLITLVIIGTIATITLPTLIQDYQKKVAVNRLKTIYTRLYAAIQHAQAENGDISTWGINFKPDSGEQYSAHYSEYAVKYSDIITPYLNPTKTVYGKNYELPTKLGYKSEAPFTGNNNPRLDISAAKGIQLADSSIIFFSVVNIAAHPFIYVDINGPKNPNKFGRDVFCFIIQSEEGKEKLIPYGSEYSINRSACGYMCAYLIVNENWEINYDW